MRVAESAMAFVLGATSMLGAFTYAANSHKESRLKIVEVRRDKTATLVTVEGYMPTRLKMLLEGGSIPDNVGELLGCSQGHQWRMNSKTPVPVMVVSCSPRIKLDLADVDMQLNQNTDDLVASR